MEMSATIYVTGTLSLLLLLLSRGAAMEQGRQEWQGHYNVLLHAKSEYHKVEISYEATEKLYHKCTAAAS